jgi:hypothetical protein
VRIDGFHLPLGVGLFFFAFARGLVISHQAWCSSQYSPGP